VSQFNYNDYQKVVEKAQSGPSTNAVKVGFFKLKGNGDEALVRINAATIEDLKFATVHKPAFGKKFEGLGTGFTPVSCLNEVGSYSDTCPFCRAAAEGHDVVGKAAKTVYVEMLVAYKDAATGSWSVAQPVVWERPAGFSRELATKLKDYGSLKEHVFKVTRQGSGKDTKYSLDFIPLYDKPELVSTDFSAFDNFNINKHSYWEKPAEDLEYYLANGSFPQAEKADDGMRTLDNGIKVGGDPVFASAKEEAEMDAALDPKPAPAVGHTAIGTNNVEAHTAIGTAEPAKATATTTEEKPAEEKPARNFAGFSF